MRDCLRRAAPFGVGLMVLAVLAFFHRGPAPCGPSTAPATVEVAGPDLTIVTRIEAKWDVVRRVLAGRLSLLEAAAAFRDIDDATAEPPREAIVPVAPAGSEDEAYCRSVIGWVRAQAPPGEAEVLAGRLEAELGARLRDGSLSLPNSPAGERQDR